MYFFKQFQFLNNSLRNYVFLMVQHQQKKKKKVTMETTKILIWIYLLWITSKTDYIILTEGCVPFCNTENVKNQTFGPLGGCDLQFKVNMLKGSIITP